MFFIVSLFSLMLTASPLRSSECCFVLQKGAIPLELRTQDAWLLEHQVENGLNSQGALSLDLNAEDPLLRRKFAKLLKQKTRESSEFNIGLLYEAQGDQKNYKIYLFEATALKNALDVDNKNPATGNVVKKCLIFIYDPQQQKLKYAQTNRYRPSMTCLISQ